MNDSDLTILYHYTDAAGLLGIIKGTSWESPRRGPTSKQCSTKRATCSLAWIAQGGKGFRLPLTQQFHRHDRYIVMTDDGSETR